MFYITDPHDETPAHVAYRLRGQRPDESLAKKIAQYNYDSCAMAAMNHSGRLASFYPIWIPGFDGNNDFDLVQYFRHQLEFMTSTGAQNLVKLQKKGTNLNKLIAVARMSRSYNRSKSNLAVSIAAATGTTFTAETIRGGSEVVSKQAESFVGGMNKLNGHLDNFYHLYLKERAGDDVSTAFQTERTALLNSYLDVNHTLNNETKRYADRLYLNTHRYLTGSDNLDDIVHKRGIFIRNLQDIEDLRTIARYGRWLGPLGYAVTFISAGAQVYEAHEHHQNMWKAIGGAVGDAAFAVGAGLAVATLLTPVGWVALAVDALAIGVAATSAGKIGERLGRSIGGETEIAIHWAKKEWHRWF